MSMMSVMSMGRDRHDQKERNHCCAYCCSKQFFKAHGKNSFLFHETDTLSGWEKTAYPKPVLLMSALYHTGVSGARAWEYIDGKICETCLYDRQEAGRLHFIKQLPACSVDFADDFLPFFPCQKVFPGRGVGRGIYDKFHHDPAIAERDITGVSRYPCPIANIAVLGPSDKGKCGWLVVYFVPCRCTFPWRYAAIVPFLLKAFIKVVNVTLSDCIDILQRDFYHI